MTSLLVITAIHLAALGQIESGNDDHAVGHRMERTRYQMMPAVMRQYPDLAKDPANASLATKYTREEWNHRVFHFAAQHNRPPNIEELALLWHCPARVMKPTMSDLDYATRFKNLVGSISKNQA